MDLHLELMQIVWVCEHERKCSAMIVRVGVSEFQCVNKRSCLGGLGGRGERVISGREGKR